MHAEQTAISFPYTDHSSHIRQLIRYTIGMITGIAGAADMLSAIVPRLDWAILLGEWPLETHQVPAQVFTVIVGFFLIMLSYGLMRGKSHAWRITLVLSVLSIILHIQRSGSILATIIAVLLATLLVVFMRFFQAKSDPPSVRRGYAALFLGLGVVVFYVVGGFIALYHDFTPLIDRIGIEGVMLRILEHTPIHVPHGTPAFFFQHAIPLLCGSAVLYGMVQIFRPVAAVLMPDMEERHRVAEIVRHYGKNSISYYALSPDKTYFFSDSGRSVISYVLEGSTAVVAGDPIGPADELPLAMQQFIQFCNEQDWTIAFWQIRAEVAPLYRAAGFHLLKIGEDAIVDPKTFTLRGNKMATVREKVKRAEKDGLHVAIYSGRVTNDEQRAQMEQISRSWLSKKSGCEMGFSQGIFTSEGDREQLYALAVDASNKVHAFMSFVPIYGRHGWGLDLMRRTDETAPGTMELILSRMIEYLNNKGAEILSLGVAPLSNANGEDETFVDSSVDFLTNRFGNPSKNYSLFFFKKKFLPTWESRYLAYSDTLSLPKIGWALYQAHQADVSLLSAARRSLLQWRQQRQEAKERAAATRPVEATQQA